MEGPVKRSTQLALVTAVGIGVVAYYLSSSETEAETTESTVFTSKSDCIESGEDANVCAARFEEAYRAHTANAPRFESKDDCERDFGVGKCEATASQSSSGGMSEYFVPAMMGFMAARMLQGGAQPQQPYPAQPLYGCANNAPAGTGTNQGRQCYSNRAGRYLFAGYLFGNSGSSSNGARQVRTPVSDFRSSNTRFNVVPRGSNISAVSGVSRSGVASRGGFGSSGRGFFGGGG